MISIWSTDLKRITAPLSRFENTFQYLLGAAQAIDRAEQVALCVEREHRRRLSIIDIEPRCDGRFPVVVTLVKLASAAIADIYLPRWIEDDVIGCAAGTAGAAAAHPAKQLFARNDDANDATQGSFLSIEHGVQCIGLLNGARESVEEEAIRTVGFLQSFLDGTEKDIIGYELATIHICLGGVPK
jgi:hypothetical protein